MTNTIILQGVEGGSTEGEDGVTYVKIGIHTGNLWEIAVEDYKRYGRIENNRVIAFSLGMTTNLAEFLLDRPYTILDDGLSVEIDIGEHSEEKIAKIIQLNKQIRKIEAELHENSKESQEIRLMLSDRDSEEYLKIIQKMKAINESNSLLPHQKVMEMEAIMEEAEITLDV